MGITRQALAEVTSGRRPPGPAVLIYLKPRQVAKGIRLYTPPWPLEINLGSPGLRGGSGLEMGRQAFCVTV
jgi:hypothetical protein